MILGLILALGQATAPAASPNAEGFKFEYIRIKDRVEADGHSRRTVEVRVLLRTPAAVQQFGQVMVPYVDQYGEVAFEQVQVTKPAGITSEVKDGLVEDLNPFGINDAAVPLDFRIRKLTVPRLEPGDSLSYRLVTSARPFVAGEAYGELKFTPVPIDGPHIYELDIPADSRLKVTLRPGLGAEWETLQGEAGRLLRRLAVTIPALVVANTGLTEAQSDALQTPDVSYTTFDSWSRVSSWWWEMSRSQVRSDAAIRQEASRLVSGLATPRQKIEAIASFVSSSVRYLNVSFGVGRMQPRSAPSVLSSRYGDCKDKVGLVMALAEAVGIEVRPVLIHTTRSELLDDTPGPHQFDHVIAAAILGPEEKDWLWIDVTNSLSPPTTLFPGARDKRALAIDDSGEGRIVRTPSAPPEPARRMITLTGEMDPSGLLKGHLRFEDRSDAEPGLRLSFASVSSEQHPELMKGVLAGPWADARLSSVRTADPADITAPFWIEVDFERDVTGVDAQKEWTLWIPDLGPVLLEASPDPTVKKAVAFWMSELTFKATVQLPEGVTGRAPLSISMNRPFASLVSNYSVSGRTLNLERIFRFPQPSIPRDQVAAYEALRKAAATDRTQTFVIEPVKAAASSASTLQREGNAAYARKDYSKAVELLRKAAQTDPKLPEVHLDLGLALRDSGMDDEAVAQYAMAIEADPFHDRVYAERAYVLARLGRHDEAENDLLKQIEVAPFKAWSYAELARRRVTQRRYTEAAELWSKSLTIDPSDADGWIALGWAHARSQNPAEARKAFVKAESVGPKEGLGVGLGLGYAFIGETAAAARVAEKDLAAIQRNVVSITPENARESFLYWSRRLSEAWLLIGQGALAEGDFTQAERYLRASWETGLLSDAGYSLGLVREQQGRPEEAADLWDAAAKFATWSKEPAELGQKLAGLRKQGVVGDGSSEQARLRILVVPGTPTLELKADLLILISGGKVEAVKLLSGQDGADWARVQASLIGLEAVATDPNGDPAKVLRRGRLACQHRVGCSVLFGVTR